MKTLSNSEGELKKIASFIKKSVYFPLKMYLFVLINLNLLEYI